MRFQKYTIFISIIFSIIYSNNSLAEKCPECGKGTKYPQCFSVEYVQEKIKSALSGCTSIKSSFLVQTSGNRGLSYEKKLEEKLMIEFCEDPINNLGTACEKFHYSRVNKQ